MSIGEICTREVVIVQSEDAVLPVSRLMRQHHVGDVVVIEERSGRNFPISIATDRDVVVELVATGLDPGVITAGDMMSLVLLTVKEGLGIYEAMRHMCNKDSAACPRSTMAAPWSASSRWTRCSPCWPRNWARCRAWSIASNRTKPSCVINAKGPVMQIPVKITVRDMPPSEALEAHIREKTQKLEQFARNIISCRVVIEMPHRHHHQGKQFNVRIGLCVPGHEIVVNRDQHEDVYVALREAFDAMKRQLEDREQRLRRETKNHAPEYVGRVEEVNSVGGYGFIIRHVDQSRLYFHRDNVVTPQFERLKAGDEVKFIEESGASGAQAKRVSLGKHHAF